MSKAVIPDVTGADKHEKEIMRKIGSTSVTMAATITLHKHRVIFKCNECGRYFTKRARLGFFFNGEKTFPKCCGKTAELICLETPETRRRHLSSPSGPRLGKAVELLLSMKKGSFSETEEGPLDKEAEVLYVEKRWKDIPKYAIWLEKYGLIVIKRTLLGCVIYATNISYFRQYGGEELIKNCDGDPQKLRDMLGIVKELV